MLDLRVFQEVAVSKLLIVAAAVALSASLQAQATSYSKGDIVQLVAPATGDPVPDSRVVAVAGDRIHADKSGIVVNGAPVDGISAKLLAQFAKPWDQVVPAGHYFVIGERSETSGSVTYHGLIPAEKIARKVSK
jgi:signal peptidase I